MDEYKCLKNMRPVHFAIQNKIAKGEVTTSKSVSLVFILCEMVQLAFVYFVCIPLINAEEIISMK